MLNPKLIKMKNYFIFFPQFE